MKKETSESIIKIAKNSKHHHIFRAEWCFGAKIWFELTSDEGIPVGQVKASKSSLAHLEMRYRILKKFENINYCQRKKETSL
jgi:hypothetical protein